MVSLIEQELSENEIVAGVNIEYAEKYGFADAEDYVFKAEKGLDEELIRYISKIKGEPEWRYALNNNAVHPIKSF